MRMPGCPSFELKLLKIEHYLLKDLLHALSSGDDFEIWKYILPV
jgi:hypothetical protein